MLVLREERTGNPLKNQWSKNESYQQTQPICNGVRVSNVGLIGGISPFQSPDSDRENEREKVNVGTEKSAI